MTGHDRFLNDVSIILMIDPSYTLQRALKTMTPYELDTEDNV